jgi:hypothetical protein
VVRNIRQEYFIGHLKDATFCINRKTFAAYLKKTGFSSFSPARKPGLTPAHMENRLKWCKDKVNWSQERWESVSWSDESKFTVVGSGEPACIAAKEEIIATHSLYPSAEGNALSTCSIRKIDAIIATEVKKERVELSTNEWKKSNVSSAIAFKQQSKNLRSNLSILNQLERKFNIQTKNILALDFLGKYL